jgi:hypothetical protein
MWQATGTARPLGSEERGRIVTTGADDVANNDDYNLIMYKVNPGFL